MKLKFILPALFAVFLFGGAITSQAHAADLDVTSYTTLGHHGGHGGCGSGYGGYRGHGCGY